METGWAKRGFYHAAPCGLHAKEAMAGKIPPEARHLTCGRAAIGQKGEKTECPALAFRLLAKLGLFSRKQ
jgi:hypothetical protein